MDSYGRMALLFLATGAFSGYVPIMPGTAGTVVGIGVFLLFCPLNAPLYCLTTLAFIFLSIWCADKAAPAFKKKDPSQIVIDEIAGYLVTMMFMPPAWAFIIGGFFLFRIMDILKPYPIRWIDRNVAGGAGIVLDDVLAGVYANIVLHLFRAIF